MGDRTVSRVHARAAKWVHDYAALAEARAIRRHNMFAEMRELVAEASAAGEPSLGGGTLIVCAATSCLFVVLVACFAVLSQ